MKDYGRPKAEYIGSRGHIDIHVADNLVYLSLGKDLQDPETCIITGVDRSYIGDMIAALRYAGAG